MRKVLSFIIGFALLATSANAVIITDPNNFNYWWWGCFYT